MDIAVNLWLFLLRWICGLDSTNTPPTRSRLGNLIRSDWNLALDANDLRMSLQNIIGILKFIIPVSGQRADLQSEAAEVRGQVGHQVQALRLHAQRQQGIVWMTSVNYMHPPSVTLLAVLYWARN